VLCNEVTLVICLLNLLTCHVFDLPTLRTLRPGSRRGPISNVFHEDHEVTGVSFMVDMLEVNVSPTHVLLCGKRFTHMITLWLFVPLIVGSRVYLPNAIGSEGHRLHTSAPWPTSCAHWFPLLLSSPATTRAAASTRKVRCMKGHLQARAIYPIVFCWRQEIGPTSQCPISTKTGSRSPHAGPSLTLH
jgi:hypothetical protein